MAELSGWWFLNLGQGGDEGSIFKSGLLATASGGISTVTGKLFVMTLKAGGAAEVKIELATSGFSTDRGNWWIEPNGRFCVRYTRFANGNLICRELTQEDGTLKAYTWDHRPNPWVFRR